MYNSCPCHYVYVYQIILCNLELKCDEIIFLNYTKTAVNKSTSLCNTYRCYLWPIFKQLTIHFRDIVQINIRIIDVTLIWYDEYNMYFFINVQYIIIKIKRCLLFITVVVLFTFSFQNQRSFYNEKITI